MPVNGVEDRKVTVSQLVTVKVKGSLCSQASEYLGIPSNVYLKIAIPRPTPRDSDLAGQAEAQKYTFLAMVSWSVLGIKSIGLDSWTWISNHL